MQAYAAGSGDNEQQVNDLGPLAWVLDELRKSLDAATKAIRRFVRDAELARGSDLESLDASQLRIARQQLHQAVGALEMVGLPEPAKLLRAMEALAQKFVQRPESCSEDAVTKVERASFALIEYLEAVLRGKTASPVALFPQYRDVLELIGEERIHPAELWPHSWRWIDAELPQPAGPQGYDAALRVQLDAAVLKVVKSGSVSAARSLRDICLGLAAGEQRLQARVLWKIAAGFFEALALKLLKPDVYVKRAASRVLLQYSTLARGQGEVSERLAQDLLFFCAQSAAGEDTAAPALAAVRQAYGLADVRPVNYEAPQFGRFDPAVLAQARKRIATATETWSALSGGDTHRLKVVSEQFTAVGESLLKLNPENKELARALLKAVDSTVRSGEPPTTPVAMEVATAILYLDAAYEDMDPNEAPLMKERSERLARRLDHVVAGGQPEPLEPWMEELYRRVSDRQTMGSVVEELRSGLSEIEKSLDTFFRDPKDKSPLTEVPQQLAQMRGVFSVLGLDQASLAVVRMRDTVERFIVDEVDEATARSGVFEKLGNSLGALGFLIDMLSYQRALAKKLFVYDEELGEFKPLMGRGGAASEAATATVSAVPAPAVPASVPVQPVAAAVSAGAVSKDEAEDEADLRDIFLQEAREVLHHGEQAVAALLEDPADLGQQTTLRRAFHTLKGSSRMVGFTEFGEAAWAMEQMMNNWLAEQKPARPELLQLAGAALQGLGRWVEDIAQGAEASWTAAPFRRSADAMRLRNLLEPLALPGQPLAAAAAPAAVPDAAAAVQVAGQAAVEPPPELGDEFKIDFAATQSPGQDESSAAPAAGMAVQALDLGDIGEIDFSSLGSALPAAPASGQNAASDEPQAPGLAAEWAATSLASPLQVEPDAVEPAPSWGATELATALAPMQQPAQQPAADWDATALARGEELPPLELPELQPNWADTAPGAFEEEMATDKPGTSGATGPVPLEGFELNLEPAAVSAPVADEQVKVIGDLRIGIPLYNVYLNEADEWSRRLVTELHEWALELHQPMPDQAIALAHSLAGSSATVGFKALSEIARALEQAMQHVQLHGQGQPEYAQTFVNAAEEIRHLLHQFAAGFLKEPRPELVQALQSIHSADFAPVESPIAPAAEAAQPEPALDLGDLNFDFTKPAAPAEPAPEPQAEVQPAPMPNLPGAAQIVAEDSGEEDIDAIDAIDPDLFPIFEEEAGELMPQLGAALRQWSTRPEDAQARLGVLRALHTLKGSARLAGAMRLGEMAHRMESAIEQMGSEYVQTAQIEPMLARFDRLQQVFDALCHGPAPQEQQLQEQAQQAAQPAAPVHEPAATAEAAPAAAQPAPFQIRIEQPAAAPAPRPAVQVQPAAALRVPQAAAPTPMRAGAGHAGQTVRVRSQLLDRLVNQAGEVMITRSRLDARLGQLHGSLHELTANLDRLRAHLRDVELQAESQMQSRLAQAKDSAQGFDPLEFDRFTRVQELTRMMAESVNDVATVQRNLLQALSGTEDDLVAQARQTRELQRDLLRTRMMEFEGIAERLYGVVRQAAKDTGKQVRLDIVGGQLEIDRGVLDRMAPAFEHMLRNAVAHGIETPQERLAAGKPAAGTITISLSQEGNDVSVVFSDDGAGLNLARIREKAAAQGLVAAGQELSDAEAANLIFMPGFSTASNVTELAGRGIGMDVVRSEVQALGGRIETATQAGVGTSFKLVLPLTTAVTQVIMLRMGELSIGVPASLVEIVRRLGMDELDRAYRSGSTPYDGEEVPFFWGGALLQASSRSSEHVGKTQPVVILRSAGQRLAMHVDEVLGNQEVVVKNLGPQLSRLPGLAGMSVLASGAVVLIYNPVALATVYGDKALQLQQAAAQPPGRPAEPQQAEPAAGVAQPSDVPLVLVVDDSITVRRVTQRLLRRDGYRVALASDGLQALERLAEERPAVVLSDIEMPRMDGFDLVRNIRADARLRDLPIIMITSRIAEKHRQHARELGVNHYLGKPYSEEELLALIRQYTAQPVPA
jgi:chemosensory pili system protein ChpA (sensor histidine kinase/response regulator)